MPIVIDVRYTEEDIYYIIFYMCACCVGMEYTRILHIHTFIYDVNVVFYRRLQFANNIRVCICIVYIL